MPKKVPSKFMRKSPPSAKPTTNESHRPVIGATTNLPAFISLTEVTFFSNWCTFLLEGTLAGKAIATPDPMMAPAHEIEKTITVDARHAWMRKGTKLLMFGGATLLSGSQSLARAILTKSDVTCIALLHGNLVVSTAPPKPSEQKYDTTTERLVVGVHWVSLTLIGEIFVVPTWRGYSPAILVRLPDGTVKHTLVGAKSFFAGLERARALYHGLSGANIQVRKLGPDQMAPYEVKVL